MTQISLFALCFHLPVQALTACRLQCFVYVNETRGVSLSTRRSISGFNFRSSFKNGRKSARHLFHDRWILLKPRSTPPPVLGLLHGLRSLTGRLA
ncbi:hypothetical protein BDQ12DRAFT_678076 [Crucibulum laeve]|uniref:Secreted protein n=1 Tax=Crucibulum laeve TaxID=68775 RepID=A0A5C3M7X9_9AGAR|nr:hypothetical protein BDQ12DRAFT_678076 [Crucibulum laeve]